MKPVQLIVLEQRKENIDEDVEMRPNHCRLRKVIPAPTGNQTQTQGLWLDVLLLRPLSYIDTRSGLSIVRHFRICIHLLYLYLYTHHLIHPNWGCLIHQNVLWIKYEIFWLSWPCLYSLVVRVLVPEVSSSIPSWGSPVNSMFITWTITAKQKVRQNVPGLYAVCRQIQVSHVMFLTRSDCKRTV